MRKLVISATLASLLTANSAWAQFFLPGPGVGVGARGGFGFGYQGRRFGVGVGYTSIYRSGGFGFGGYPGYSLYAPSVIVTPPPIVVVQPPVIVAGARANVGPAAPPLDPKRFIVITPDDKPARNPAAPPRPEQPAKKEVVRVPPPKLPVVERPGKPVKPVDLGVKPVELPLAPPREANGRAEADRQIELGRAAFASGGLGKALERFKQAVAVAPAESSAYFLLAQAQYALGKYADAVSSIENGLKLQPDWPQTRFRFKDMYGQNLALFDEHLRHLRTALQATPEDARLLFLLGVELWFDGQRDEATRFLQQAATRMTNTPAVERFIAPKR